VCPAHAGGRSRATGVRAHQNLRTPALWRARIGQGWSAPANPRGRPFRIRDAAARTTNGGDCVTRNLKAPPGAHRTGRTDEPGTMAATSAPSLPEQARQLAGEAQHCHPDLSAWAQGFLSGWDAAWSAGVWQAVMQIAEAIA